MIPVKNLAREGLLSCQNINRYAIGCEWQAACIVVPEIISSTWVKPDLICDYIFCTNNSACWDLISLSLAHFTFKIVQNLNADVSNDVHLMLW